MLGNMLIKKIRTDNGLYIYDTWTNAILKVSPATFNMIPDNYPELNSDMNLSLNDKKEALSELHKAREKGYLREGYPEIESFPETVITSIVDETVSKGPDLLTLNITEKCNLRCRYCSFSGAYPENRMHSVKTMSRKTADKIISWYLSRKGRSEFHFGFYGGEPFMEFPFIRDIVRDIRRKCGEKASFFITTNATLLDDEICKFIIKEKVSLTVSLDGPSEVHDRYRTTPIGEGSFSSAWKAVNKLYEMDKGWFKDNVHYNIVLAPPAQINKIRSFISDNPLIFSDYSKISISLINNEPSNIKEYLGLTGKNTDTAEKKECFDSFISDMKNGNAPNGFSGSYYSRSYLFIHRRNMNVMPEKTPSSGQCIPGERKCFVNTDGILYMCERVGGSYPIGTSDEGLDGEKIRSFLDDYNNFLRIKCSKCWAVRLCRKCLSSLGRSRGLSKKRLDEFCASSQKSLHRTLTNYCGIREANDDAFKWTEDIILK